MKPVTGPQTERRRRLLIAEDEENLRALLKLSLGQAYDVVVVEDGQAALDSFAAGEPEMVILDIMMPRVDGLSACRQIRQTSDVPIIMLTALGSVDDIVKGFGMGADDYITKPFTFKELLVRVQAVFRRLDWSQPPAPPNILVNGDLKVNCETHQTWLGAQEVHLTPIEFQLLQYLASRPGQGVSKEQLFRDVWGYDLAGGTNLVEVGVRRLREKIERNAAEPRLLLTLRGFGYQFRSPPDAKVQ
jgi:DNA-binding response OmpR family regulator